MACRLLYTGSITKNRSARNLNLSPFPIHHAIASRTPSSPFPLAPEVKVKIPVSAMSDSSDSVASTKGTTGGPSKAQGSAQETVTDDSDFSSQVEDDDSDDSSSESETQRSKENTRGSAELTQQKQLDIQQRQRVEAKREEEAKRQEAERQARLEAARKQEEAERQAKRRAFVEPTGPQVEYSCADCNGDVNLDLGELVRCQHCGCRILFKKKTNRYVFSRNPRGWDIDLFIA